MTQIMHFKALRLIAALLLLPLCAMAQLTLKVTSIPGNTPTGDKIYAVGTFNTWNPSDPAAVLTKGSDGNYTITLNPPKGEVKFKFTRGGWPKVEGNASGSYLPDRIHNYTGQPTTLTLSILSWEDLGSGGTSTAAGNVAILDDDFNIPQLNRKRRIWIYLPPDYQTSAKRYPVLYMHDGQNLFDAKTTAFGVEWGVDESLNTLHQQGDYGCIVIGIDNSDQRLNEYSPWVNPQYGGGQGDEYVDFIVKTLKPYVDANYRTLTERQATGIMGSSMGGLISMYAFSERQDVFSKAGIFSPAFWFKRDSINRYVATHTKKGNARVYFLAGANESSSVNVAQDAQQVANSMTAAGFTASEKTIKVAQDGEHSEWFWAREFPDAYKWLFKDALSTTNTTTSKDKLEVFPNPAGEWVRFSGVPTGEMIRIQVIGTDGRVWRDSTVRPEEPYWTGDLPKGVYVVKAKRDKGKWVTGRLVRA